MAHPQHAVPLILPDGEVRAVERAPVIERVSWAFYDFANTIFSMNIATMYFAVWLVDDLHVSNTMAGVANAIASALVFASVPFLGALSDVRRRRKPWVVAFTVVSCLAVALMGILGQRLLPLTGTSIDVPAVLPPGWRATGMPLFWVLATFVLATFAYQAAQPFYNAMMPELAPVEEQGRLSGFGTALGYVGSIVGVLLVLPFFNAPRGTRVSWRKAVREVRHTIRDARQHPGTLRFILASFVYQDAIGTIIGGMALYAVNAMGFEKGAETTLFLVLTVPSIFGSYIYGLLVDRIGGKRSLMMTLLLWIGLLALMIVVPGKAAFWIVGLAVGLNFGGVPTAERPVLLGLVPDVEAGRYFSLMLLSSRAAAIVGPLIWGLTVDGLKPSFGVGIAYRAAVVTVALMFVISALILRGVPDRFQKA